MYFDSGRLADLRMLEQKLKEASSPAERAKYQGVIDTIKRQAENPQLNKKREELMEMRRRTINAKGDANIKNLRDEADRLEESIDKEIRV